MDRRRRRSVRLPTRRGRPLLLTFAVGLLLVWIATPGAIAQDDGAAGASARPTAAFQPTPGPAVDTGDPRSDGQGPGLVGEPLAVLAGVILIALATVLVTVVLARVTGRA